MCNEEKNILLVKIKKNIESFEIIQEFVPVLFPEDNTKRLFPMVIKKLHLSRTLLSYWFDNPSAILLNFSSGIFNFKKFIA